MIFVLRLGRVFCENKHTHQIFSPCSPGHRLSPPLSTLSFGNWSTSKGKKNLLQKKRHFSYQKSISDLELCVCSDSCGCVHIYTHTCVRVCSEVRSQCSTCSSIPLYLIFFGVGSLTGNMEFDLARPTDHQGPGSSPLFFPRTRDPNSVLMTCGGHFIDGHPSRPLVHNCEAEVNFAGLGFPFLLKVHSLALFAFAGLL